MCKPYSKVTAVVEEYLDLDLLSIFVMDNVKQT